MIDFKDQVREILNLGLVQVGFGTGVPGYKANPGQLYVQATGTTGRLYATTSQNTWTLFSEVTI